MIARIWHGWTTPANADGYERLLREEIFPEIEAKNVSGYLGIELLRERERDGEVEFVTVMHFESIDAVRAFAGDDYETAYVPPAAREVLAHWDVRSAHYQVKERRTYG
ncbi:MAG: antibiotic biosynthesis monooxygenase [Gemmatimonadota bacterium]